MSAKTSSYIQTFLNKTPVSKTNLNDTLLARVGLRVPALYQQPKEPQISLVKDLCRTLYAFEQAALAKNPDKEVINQLEAKLQGLITALELQTIRPAEAGVDKDWILFAPIIKDNKTPLKMPAILAYRFGFVIDRATTDPNYTVNNIAVISEHAGQDGTERVVGDLFAKNKAKFAILTVLKPHTVPNPAYPKNSRIKYFTDPAHSNTTIFLPILQTLLNELFPKIPALIMHGMGAKEGVEYQNLQGNCYGKYRVDGWRSFATMLGLSFGIEDFYTSPANKQADKPSPVVAVCSRMPNTVLKGGKIIPMSSDKGKLNGALRWTGGTITTNVSGHIGYFSHAPLTAKIAQGYTLPSDRMIHVELTGYVRANKSASNVNRDQFIKVVQRAINWYKNYDPAIHDPYKLAQRFPEIAKNMKLYPTIFTPAAIKEYKKNHKEQYQKDKDAYKAQFAKNPQLPPPLPTPTEPATPAAIATVQVSVTPAITSNTTQPLIFSAVVASNPQPTNTPAAPEAPQTQAKVANKPK